MEIKEAINRLTKHNLMRIVSNKLYILNLG